MMQQTHSQASIKDTRPPLQNLLRTSLCSVLQLCNSAVCDKKNAKHCARCLCTSYCSTKCQQDDWKTHKLLCASFTAFAATNRPTSDHRRAVLFNQDKKKPEFIWLRRKWIRDIDVDGDGYHILETAEIIGDDTLEKHSPIQYNTRLKRALPNTINIIYRDTFLVDGSRPNKSVASVTATQPGEYHDWRGLIIAHADLGQGLHSTGWKDFDMIDFRHVNDYFLSYAYTPPEAQATVRRVKGVRINCLGDVKMLKRPRFEDIELPTTDVIFTKHDTSDIANRIGIPILTRRCAPDPKWADSKDPMFEHRSPFENQSATFLHQCCDPNDRGDFSNGFLGWGWCPMQWQNDVGSVVVVRKDKRTLLPIHMEALAGYCQNEIGPLMGHSTGEYYPEEPIEKHHVLEIICRPMFVLYWSKFVEKQKDYTPSPYEYKDL
jgi:hypothetical protein